MSHHINISWKNEYALGDAIIDEQHQEFFTIVQKAQQLHTIIHNEEKKKELRAIMTELFKYINFHFDTEETFMKKIQYPHLDEHLKLHKDMKDQLNFINFNLISIDIAQAEQKLYNFVEKIFVHHITTEDLKVVNYKKSLVRQPF